MADRLAVGWLVDGWSAGRLAKASWLSSGWWLAAYGCFVDWLAGWLVLAGWPSGWLAFWLVACMALWGALTQGITWEPFWCPWELQTNRILRGALDFTVFRDRLGICSGQNKSGAVPTVLK